jgi:protein FAM32A
MPSDEYASTSRGGLKLKGGSGITKKKKKSKKDPEASASSAKKSAIQKALEDEDGKEEAEGKGKELSEEELKELEERGGEGAGGDEEAEGRFFLYFLLRYFVPFPSP